MSLGILPGSWLMVSGQMDSTVLRKREPSLVKKRLSFLGSVHDGTRWHGCPTCPCTASGELTDVVGDWKYVA